MKPDKKKKGQKEGRRERVDEVHIRAWEEAKPPRVYTGRKGGQHQLLTLISGEGIRGKKRSKRGSRHRERKIELQAGTGPKTGGLCRGVDAQQRRK